jgi:hypothetical protein
MPEMNTTAEPLWISSKGALSHRIRALAARCEAAPLAAAFAAWVALSHRLFGREEVLLLPAGDRDAAPLRVRLGSGATAEEIVRAVALLIPEASEVRYMWEGQTLSLRASGGTIEGLLEPAPDADPAALTRWIGYWRRLM